MGASQNQRLKQAVCCARRGGAPRCLRAVCNSLPARPASSVCENAGGKMLEKEPKSPPAPPSFCDLAAPNYRTGIRVLLGGDARVKSAAQAHVVWVCKVHKKRDRLWGACIARHWTFCRRSSSKRLLHCVCFFQSGGSKVVCACVCLSALRARDVRAAPMAVSDSFSQS